MSDLDGVDQPQTLVRDKPANNQCKMSSLDQAKPLLVNPELCRLGDDDDGVIGDLGCLYLDELVANKLRLITFESPKLRLIYSTWTLSGRMALV